MATAALLTGAGFCVLAALEAQRLGHVVSGRRHVIHAAVMATGAVLALVALRADRSDPEVLSLLPEST